MSSRIYKSKYTGQEIDDLLGQVSSKVDDSMLGAAGGVATLDTSGKIPSQQMPENVAYTNKENTFTEPQTFSYVDSVDPNWSEYGEIGGSSANYSYTEYTDDTHKYSTSGEAYISAFTGRVMVGRSTFDEKGISKNSLVLDVRKNWIARTEINAERVDGELGTAVQTYYAYKFPKTYPNKEVTLATIEDLTAQFGALNIQNGSGVNSIKQKPDGETFSGLQKGATENNTTVEYNTDAAGQNSTILGGKNRAEAKRSTAIGGYNVAAGASSLATGEQTITEGRCSFSTGQRTRAKGGSSLAAGGYSLALGDFSMTQGYQTEASGRSAMATGAGTSAEGAAALSGGTGTKAIGDASVAFGNETQSKGNYSAAFGSSTQANGVNSVAIGDKSIANAASSKVEGINNIANNSAYVAPTPGGSGGGSVEPTPPSTFNVEEHYGEGSHVEGAYNSAYGFASHAEGLKVSARGHYSHAEGTATISAGESSHAEGGNTQANGKWSHAEGDSSIASNNGSHAEGKSQATGGYSHSEGSGTKAIGQGSHAEGRNTQAEADFSHAEGVSSVSSGQGSHAEGNSTASNTYAHSEGWSTTASGENSHSQGKWTKAVGDNSTAVGISTTATGNNSFAGGNGSEAVKNGSFVHGFGLKSNQENQAVFGVYNAPYNATLLVVGNGTQDNYRTNAFEVYQDGRAKVYGAPEDDDDVIRKGDITSILTLNIENGTGDKSLQQVIDSDFTLVNINSDRTGQTIQSGAVGQFAAAFGGKSRSEGKRALSAGTQTIAIGNYSAAFGNNSISEGVNSFVEGSQNISRGNSSHAENANNLAAADNTHVEGVENTATHMGAHVQGYKNGSFGDYTHTEGGENVSSTAANVTYSHIGGYKNTMVITGTANPDASEGGSTPGGGESTSKPTEFWATFIDGAWNKASGTNSFTIGYWNQNYGNGTFIAGHNNIIYNNVETAMLFGRQLQGGRNCQVVFGENNLLNKDALLIVGNGTGVTGPNRFSNAFEVLKDGRAKVQTAPKEDNDVVRKLELDTKLDKTGGTIGGNVIITGDLTVNGTQHINNTENLNVENAMIYSNAKGATLATNGGIGIKKNAADVYGIVYDPTSDSVKLGLGKSDANGVFTFNENEGQPVAIRDDSSKFTNNNLVKWDSESYKFVDSGKKIDDLIAATNLENGTGDVLIQTTDSNQSFKVMTDGRAKVQSAPAENDDVLRLNELSILTQEQVNSLF